MWIMSLTYHGLYICIWDYMGMLIILILLGTRDCHYVTGFPWDDQPATTLKSARTAMDCYSGKNFLRFRSFWLRCVMFFKKILEGIIGHPFFFWDYILNLIQVSIFLILKHWVHPRTWSTNQSFCKGHLTNNTDHTPPKIPNPSSW